MPILIDVRVNSNYPVMVRPQDEDSIEQAAKEFVQTVSKALGQTPYVGSLVVGVSTNLRAVKAPEYHHDW